MSRREKIEEMLQASPQDVFLSYALALEWDKEGEFEKSLELFNQLMTNSEPYVPAFFMAGQLLVRLERNEEARQVLSDGIANAERTGDAHAAKEMTEFLAGINENF